MESSLDFGFGSFVRPAAEIKKLMVGKLIRKSLLSTRNEKKKTLENISNYQKAIIGSDKI